MTAWGTLALAVVTVGTLIAAIVGLRIERKERRDQANRDRAVEHRRQADAVSAWYDAPVEPHEHARIELINLSGQPVYDVVASFVWVQGAGPTSTKEWVERGEFEQTRCLVVLPPGTFRVYPFGPGDSPMQGRLGAEIGFTDVHGTHWVRRAAGELEELPTNAIDAFEIWRPVDFVTPQRR